MKIIGIRTLTFALFAGVVLLAGFWLVPPDQRGAAFVFFSGSLAALMVAVAGKSVGSKLAERGVPAP